MKPQFNHVCCNIDDNYAQHCGVMLCSLFESNKGSQFEIHILISCLEKENKEKLQKLIEGYGSICQFHVVDHEKLKGVKYRENRPLSEATYYRILLASILDSSISKVLYLDSDIFVLGDVSSLFSLNLKGYALAATKDLANLNDEVRFLLSLPHGDHYFCAGVMLINLDYWREYDAEPDLIDFAKSEGNVYNHDQDALNGVFHGKWMELSPKWNRFFPHHYGKQFFDNRNDKREFEENPVIIHFANYFKPWNRFYWLGIRWNKYKGYYSKYLKMTPWRNDRFRSVKLKLGEYRKFGLYKFLITYSVQSIFLDFFSILDRVIRKLERLVFFPFLIVLKIYYKLRASR